MQRSTDWLLSHPPISPPMTARFLYFTVASSLLLATLLISGCSTSRRPITAVQVRDSDFELVKELDSTELAAFERHWNTRRKLFHGSRAMAQDPYGHYKLDIRRGDRASGDRWLYYISGEVTLLTVMAGMADYQIQDVRAFNKLIGAVSARPQPRHTAR
jgi:hypothetical protein